MRRLHKNAGQPRDPLEAQLEIGRRSLEQGQNGMQIRKGRVQFLPLCQPDSDPRFDQPDEIVAPEAIDVPAAFEDPAIYAIAEAIPVRNGDIEPAAGLQNPPDLVNGGIRIQKVLQGVITDREVDARRGDRQLLAASDHARAPRAGEGRRRTERMRILIDSDHRASEVRRGKAAAGGSNVQNAIAATELCEPIVQVSWDRSTLAPLLLGRAIRATPEPL